MTNNGNGLRLNLEVDNSESDGGVRGGCHVFLCLHPCADAADEAEGEQVLVLRNCAPNTTIADVHRSHPQATGVDLILDTNGTFTGTIYVTFPNCQTRDAACLEDVL